MYFIQLAFEVPSRVVGVMVDPSMKEALLVLLMAGNNRNNVVIIEEPHNIRS